MLREGIDLLEDRKAVQELISKNIIDKQTYGEKYIELRRKYKQELTAQTIKLIMRGATSPQGVTLPPLPPSTAKDVARGIKSVTDIEVQMDTNKLLSEVAQENIYALKEESKSIEADLKAQRGGY